MAIGVSAYPGAIDTVKTLVEAANDAITTLTAPLGISDSTAQVASTARFSNSGFFVVEGEILSFDGKTPTTLNNLTHGEQATTPSGHASGVDVEQMVTSRDHNVLAEAILVVEAKLGAGASMPVAGQALRGTAGGSAWQDRTYTHTQNSAATVWTITHNLGCNPSVSVVDSAGTLVIGQVEYLSVNQIRLTFSAAFSGQAYLN